MTRILITALLALGSVAPAAQTDGWVSLFDGKTLDGWKASENPSTFSVADGAIVVNGDRSHLYYVGPVNNHVFTNFEFKADVMTTPGSNSGMYFHTEFQEGGWPAKGYEVQVNNSHTDWRRTGGLYAIVDVKEAPAKDDTWFTQQITVTGKHVVIKRRRQGHRRLHRAAERRAAGGHGRAQDRVRHLRAAGARPEEQGVLQEHHGESASKLRC